VRLIAFCDEQEFVVQVSDTGIGMAPEDIPRALERFGQLDGDLNRKYEGTGLGLPLTKKLAELHGGRLEIESALCVGTKVTVAFPAERLNERSEAA
jgi:signal transduction histidine kinase